MHFVESHNASILTNLVNLQKSMIHSSLQIEKSGNDAMFSNYVIVGGHLVRCKQTGAGNTMQANILVTSSLHFFRLILFCQWVWKAVTADLMVLCFLFCLLSIAQNNMCRKKLMAKSFSNRLLGAWLLFQGFLFFPVGLPVFFVGGPAWAMDWCPMPNDVLNEYVAISCYRDMDQCQFYDEVEPYPGLIQIWDLSNIQNRYSKCMYLSCDVFVKIINVLSSNYSRK